MNASTRPPPPQGAPPSYALVTRVYKGSLRPAVMFTTFVSALWLLLWGVASFRDISIDEGKLDVMDIVLGTLFMTAFAIELFGFVAAFLQKLPMIRLYAYASLGAAVVVTAAELIEVIIHFVFKNTLINDCAESIKGDTIRTRWGFWGADTITINDDETAHEVCRDAWGNAVFPKIAWFIVVALLSFLFASIAFSYYRQMLDPASVANFSRTAAPQHYNPPYATNYAGYGNGPHGGGFAPPAGPPPAAQSQPYVPQYDGAKLPEYEQGGYTGRTGVDVKDDDLKGGNDPFSDYEARTGAGTRASSGRGSGESSREREDPYAIRRV